MLINKEISQLTDYMCRFVSLVIYGNYVKIRLQLVGSKRARDDTHTLVAKRTRACLERINAMSEENLKITA